MIVFYKVNMSPSHLLEAPFASLSDGREGTDQAVDTHAPSLLSEEGDSAQTLESAEPDLLDLVQSQGVNGFLAYLNQREVSLVSAKLGGTAMTNAMEEGERSQVLNGIEELQKVFHGKLVLVVSAPGKIYGNTRKITQRLIAGIKAFKKNNDEEGEGIIQSLEKDHLRMIEENITEEKRAVVRQSVQKHFSNIRDKLKNIAQQTPGYILDTVAGIGEELASIILAAMLNGVHVSTQNNQVTASTDGIPKNFQDVIHEFSQMIQAAIQENNNLLNIVPGFPGFIQHSGTISETGMGYSDFSTIMATPENGFVILLKQSGAVLQTNPNLLPEGYPVNKINIMPYRQAVRMTDIIGDAIQVVHPMALAEAQRKNITIMVIDEKNPFNTGATLILPNNVYDQYQSQGKRLDPMPMMGVADNAHELRIIFHTPASEIRKSKAISELEQRLVGSGVKVVYKGQIISADDGSESISLIVAGMPPENHTLSDSKKITDILSIEIGESSYIIGISAINKKNLLEHESEIVNIFSGARLFHRESNDRLTSFGILVPDNNKTRDQNLKRLMEILNS